MAFTLSASPSHRFQLGSPLSEGTIFVYKGLYQEIFLDIDSFQGIDAAFKSISFSRIQTKPPIMNVVSFVLREGYLIFTFQYCTKVYLDRMMLTSDLQFRDCRLIILFVTIFYFELDCEPIILIVDKTFLCLVTANCTLIHCNTQIISRMIAGVQD